MRGHDVLTSSANQSWGTPWWLYELLDSEFHFVLDAAADIHNAKSAVFYTEEDNALVLPWGHRTFLNPPYSEVAAFMAKAALEAHEGNCVVCIVPARVDTNWWYDSVHGIANEVRFIKGRIKFQGAKASAPFPCAVVIYTGHTSSGRTEYTVWDVDEYRLGKKESGAGKMAKRKTISKKQPKTAVATAPQQDTNPISAAVPSFAPSNGHGTLEHFTALKTNMKGVTRDLELSKLVAVCGENRSGKTSVRAAFEMGLTGRVPGCVHAADYMEFAPSSSDNLHAMLVSSAGSAHFEVTSGKKPPTAPEYYGALKVLDDALLRESALPSTTMKNFLVGDKKARQAIFKRFGSSVVALNGSVPMPPGLNDEQQALWNEGVADLRGGLDDIAEILSEMNGVMRSKKLALGREASAMEKQLAETREYLTQVTAGAELLPQLEAAYKDAIAYENAEETRRQLTLAEAEYTALEQEAQSFVASVQTLEAEEQSLKAIEAQAAELVASLEAGRAALAAAVEAASPRLTRVKAIKEVTDAMAAANVHSCPVCEQTADPQQLAARLSGILAERQAQYEQAASALRAHDAQIQEAKSMTTLDRQRYEERKRRSDGDRANLKARAAGVKGRIEALKSAIGSLSAPAESSVVVREKIEQVRQGDAIRATVGQLEGAIRTKRNAQAVAKVLETEAENLLQNLLRQAAGGAEQAINRYMPEGFRAELDLSGGGCEWRVIGSDGRAHNKHSICGAEKASLLIALALAWTEGAPVRVLTLDDEDLGPFHSSPKNLQLLLARIKEAVDAGALTQALVCGVRASEVPAGWQKIEMAAVPETAVETAPARPVEAPKETVAPMPTPSALGIL